MLRKSLYIFIFGTCLVSCNFFKQTDERKPIARVNDTYLYEDDIKDLVVKGTSPQDSVMLVNSYINRWATQLLLLEGSERNLPVNMQESFNKLVDEYKRDLYTKAYLEALVKKSIDTAISRSEANALYEENRETFKLNDELIRLRYVHISQSDPNKDEITKRFAKFEESDKTYLDSLSTQFKSYSLNDSVWVKAAQVVQRIPVLTAENKKELLKKSNFLQLKDALDLYLVHVNDVLLLNDYAPLEYVMPTIKQIIINKRKLELIKQLETDITKDATKNNQFEIFSQP